MGIKAAGTYLRTLREAKGLSRRKFAFLVGADDSQVERLEKGQVESRATLVAAFVRAVEGDPAQVMNLLLDVNDSEQLGQQAAEALTSARLKPAAWGRNPGPR